MDQQSFRWTLHQRNIDTVGCWIWQGQVNDRGYPIFKDGRLVHRQVARVNPDEVGIFQGIRFTRQVHHKCMVKLCVNPFHLSTLSRTRHKKWHTENQQWNAEPKYVAAKVLDGYYLTETIPPALNCRCHGCKTRRKHERKEKAFGSTLD